jgi:hypothetical protein
MLRKKCIFFYNIPHDEGNNLKSESLGQSVSSYIFSFVKDTHFSIIKFGIEFVLTCHQMRLLKKIDFSFQI